MQCLYICLKCLNACNVSEDTILGSQGSVPLQKCEDTIIIPHRLLSTMLINDVTEELHNLICSVKKCFNCVLHFQYFKVMFLQFMRVIPSPTGKHSSYFVLFCIYASQTVSCLDMTQFFFKLVHYVSNRRCQMTKNAISFS